MKKILAMMLVAGLTITNVLCFASKDDYLLQAELTASAEQYGKYFTYNNIDEDGDGKFDSVELTKCDESAKSVLIPSKMNGLPVTRIGDSAFKDCSYMTDVVIPDSVTSIGSWAFHNCTYLESVTIGSSVETIGTWAFYKCSGLKNVIIPNSVANIGSRAFADCTELASVTIGNQVKDIGNYAFNNCYSLKEITIPENVSNIAVEAFSNCKTIYGKSGSTAQNYAEQYNIEFISIGTAITTTTVTSTTNENRNLLYSEVVNSVPCTDYSVSSINVKADNQNYNYNDEEFKVDEVVVTAEVVQMQNLREYINYYWSDGSITNEVKTLLGPTVRESLSTT